MPKPFPKTVRELMQGEVFTVSPDTNMPDLQRRFASTRVGALPVVEADRKIVGIVSRFDVMRRFSIEQSLAELADSEFDQTLGIEDRDDSITVIGAAVGRRLSQVHASDIMIKEVASIGPEATPGQAARQMTKSKIHRLPVVEDGHLIGIVSAFDFMRLYAENES